MVALSLHSTIAIVGAGTMGAGIAQVAAQAGHSVLLMDQQLATASTALQRLRQGLDRQVARNRLSQTEATAILSRITPTDQLQSLAGCVLVIEAIIENIAAKQQVIEQLMDICGPDCIYASNTSSIPIAQIAAGLKYPGQVAGLHFFNPAQVMKLVEVISQTQTDSNLASKLKDTMQQWGKVAVFASDTPGFIVNRIARPFYAEALRMATENLAEYAVLDQIMRQGGGFRMGPFELMDLIGLDVNHAVTQLVTTGLSLPMFEISSLQQQFLDAGHLGKKTGRGFYDYADSSSPARSSVSVTPASVQVDMVISADLGWLQPLAQRLLDSGHRTVSVVEQGFLQLAGVSITPHLGAPLPSHAGPTIALDLAFDYGLCKSLACQRSDSCSKLQLKTVRDAFATIGIELVELPNQPGLPVTRTLAMLANVAADAVQRQVCTVSDADLAMRFGVNYPLGPLAWADQVGLEWLLTTLNNLALHVDQNRYTPCDWIRQLHQSGARFYDHYPDR